MNGIEQLLLGTSNPRQMIGPKGDEEVDLAFLAEVVDLESELLSLSAGSPEAWTLAFEADPDDGETAKPEIKMVADEAAAIEDIPLSTIPTSWLRAEVSVPVVRQGNAPALLEGGEALGHALPSLPDPTTLVERDPGPVFAPQGEQHLPIENDLSEPFVEELTSIAPVLRDRSLVATESSSRNLLSSVTSGAKPAIVVPSVKTAENTDAADNELTTAPLKPLTRGGDPPEVKAPSSEVGVPSHQPAAMALPAELAKQTQTTAVSKAGVDYRGLETALSSDDRSPRPHRSDPILSDDQPPELPRLPISASAQDVVKQTFFAGGEAETRPHQPIIEAEGPLPSVSQGERSVSLAPSPVAVTPAAQQGPQFQTAQVSQAIAVHVEKARATGEVSQIELRLDPEELGKLKITFTPREAGVMMVSLAAERLETIDLLKRNADALLQEFVGMGLGDTELSFQQQDEWAGSAEGSQEDEQIVQIETLEVQALQPSLPAAADDRLDIRL